MGLFKLKFQFYKLMNQLKDPESDLSIKINTATEIYTLKKPFLIKYCENKKLKSNFYYFTSLSLVKSHHFLWSKSHHFLWLKFISFTSISLV